MDIVALGFLVFVMNTERRILPQYGSHCTCCLMWKALHPLHAPVPDYFNCSSQSPIFSLKLFILMQCSSNQPLHPYYHPSTSLLSTLNAEELLKFPSLFNTAYKKTSSNLSLLPFLPSSFPLVLPITIIMKQMCSMKTIDLYFGSYTESIQFSLRLKIPSRSSQTRAFRNIGTSHILTYKCDFKY